ncbi:hypothetical protein OG339_24305 [Streptosporangium sp. NBC_01495]|uniref:hypothetical protein n=1 Tax=Streptosporangium sp. NBC_01495 TaxID=2903899 RepID=UPI002E36236D|nr:hypothetical protein [Streptosporangium sp. NBC_01495]
MDPTGPIARRFPLIARPRPACGPLNVRVGELCALADAAERDGNPSSASAVFNQAALLASDVGLPNLARAWCHRHAELYLRACPLSAQAARRALEPLVNLARLRIRDGDGDAALRLLTDLYDAVTARTNTVIDGLPVPAGTLTTTGDDHQEVRRWLWSVLLAEGARALTGAGRWQNALTHLRRHNGVGRRMLDGRQVAVIASATAGDTDGALALLANTLPGEPWENAVTACLTVLCHRHTHRPTNQEVTAMLDRYQQLPPVPGLVVFGVRLGLSVLDAAKRVDHPGARGMAASLIRRTVTSSDGYAAREVLAHEECAALLTDMQARELAEVLNACALGHKALPARLKNHLSAALDTSETVITHGHTN